MIFPPTVSSILNPRPAHIICLLLLSSNLFPLGKNQCGSRSSLFIDKLADCFFLSISPSSCNARSPFELLQSIIWDGHIKLPIWNRLHIWNSESCFYEGTLHKRFMNFLTLQPLVVDQALMPYMKAMHVPFHLLYGSLICYQRLQSDRPKWRGMVAEVSQTQKHMYKIPISWTIGQILISVDSPECPLSDEVW